MSESPQKKDFITLESPIQNIQPSSEDHFSVYV
jgi:hypothetical protein